MKKKLIVVALILILLVLGIVVFKNNKNENTNTTGLTKVESYNSSSVCDAAIPSCGYCPGITVKDECFVDETKLTDAEMQRYGLN